MFRNEARAKIEHELAQAQAARQAGSEGRARVCARRAAGAAIREYMEQAGLPLPAGGRAASAYDLLGHLHALAGQPGSFPADTAEKIVQVTGHLRARVDEQFNLPVEADLLAGARWLADALEAHLPGAAAED
jgi:8-oxo-dGTP pyrophosphatase MutT (NUDIX family)